MDQGREIISHQKFGLIVRRLAYQLVEVYSGFENACIIGIQPRGTFLSDQIVRQLRSNHHIDVNLYGKLDITFYRDDYKGRTQPLIANETHMNFNVENKKVLLIDDVLYTGRSIHAAISALQHYGRPAHIELLTFIDRRFNRDFPIQADYMGLAVDSVDEAYVKLHWNDSKTSASVNIYPHKTNPS